MTVEYKKERKELYCSAMNAILDLVPEGKFSIQGNDLSTIDWQGGGTQPSDSAITAKIAERETAWDATEEARVSRFIAYPDIKEQLKIANGRTRALENWRNYILGGMAIITLFLTITI